MIYLRFAIGICALLLTQPLSAGKLTEKIKSFFSKVSVPANISEGDIVYDDTVGVNFIGGSGFIRSPVEDIHPVHISLPQINAGCGGIDYSLGGIHLISSADMKRALEGIAKNAVSYAFLLAMEASSPISSGVMSKMQTWANQINGFNINSCEIASSLVNGAWAKISKSEEFACSQMVAQNGLVSDLIFGRRECNSGTQKSKEAKKLAKKEGILVGDYNLAWEVIKELVQDRKIQNLYLNISGTIIKEGEKIQVFPPKTKEALEVLMKGGTITDGYAFAGIEKGNQMKVAKNNTFTVEFAQSEKGQVMAILGSLKTKILDETDQTESLTRQEQQLIARTQFPIASLMILMGQWGGENAIKHFSLRDCAEIIAFERVSGYVEEILKRIIANVDLKNHQQLDQDQLKEFKNNLEHALTELERLKMDNYRKISEKQKMIQFLIEVEKGLRESPSPIFSNN